MNRNRGFKELDVWKDAIELYVVSVKTLSKFPYELKKTSGNAIDASHSISRNIAEGYCRKSRREYLNFLNYSLGSSGEFHSCIVSFQKADQISKEDYEKMNEIQYRLENRLLKLISSLASKS